MPKRTLRDYARDGGVFYDCKEIAKLLDVVDAARGVMKNPNGVRAFSNLCKAITALDAYVEEKEVITK